jgi:hypothetical protein
MFDFLTPPPDAKPWQKKIKVGDYLMKSSQGFLIFQLVSGMSQSPKSSRYVKGFSAMCVRGEFGDTYIHDVDAYVSPALWTLLRVEGWPETLKGMAIEIIEVEKNGEWAPMVCLTEEGKKS